jgi:glycosyltransferase involved in cell wall biosynthesis
VQRLVDGGGNGHLVRKRPVVQKQHPMIDPDTPLPTNGRPPRVALLSLSPIVDDPRVRRQGDALVGSGWDITAFGLSGGNSAPPAWPIVAVDKGKAGGAPRWRGVLALPLIPGRIRNAFWLLLARLGPDHAERAYWKLKPSFLAMATLAGARRFDLVVANDWPSLGAGLRIAREQGIPLIYDTHEFATDEYGHRGLWRFFYQPFLVAFEGQAARQAAFVTCVSDGIADALQAVHDLAARPTVIRNMPSSYPAVARPAGDIVRVLYHGIVTPGRGLEACIASVPLWPQGYELTIRGPGAPTYLDALRRQALEAGVEERVTFAPPVAMTDLVAAASAFDIGLFSMPAHSVQGRFVLPNKFFEYTGAGLALCVSDLPEMRRLLLHYGLGELITGDTPADIAAAISKLDRDAILQARKNAVEAARELCWERERERFLALCREAIATKAGTQTA